MSNLQLKYINCPEALVVGGLTILGVGLRDCTLRIWKGNKRFFE